MSKIIEWAKSHPVYIVGGVAVVGVVLLLVNASGGAAAAAPSAATGTGGQDDALQLQTEQDQTQIALATIQAGTQNNSTNVGGSVQLDSNDKGLTATLAQLLASTQQNADTIAGQTAQAQILGNTQIAITGLTTGAQVQTALGADAANVDIAQANATTQQLISQYQSQAMTQQAQILGNTQLGIAKSQAGSSMFGSALGFLGGLF
jgi:hypothetical protein